jgi:nicotinamidase-related amidase
MDALSPKTCALVLIDVINAFAFPAGPSLLAAAVPAARRIATLKKRLSASGIPAIYVNDNFGEWKVDFRMQIQRCLTEERGRQVAELLLPQDEDYFVLKPRHSGFYSTSLDVLLSFLGTRTLILTGFATDICVLYTANDAYMRGYALRVPSDCVAAETPGRNRWALTHIKTRLFANTAASPSVR